MADHAEREMNRRMARQTPTKKHLVEISSDNLNCLLHYLKKKQMQSTDNPTTHQKKR